MEFYCSKCGIKSVDGRHNCHDYPDCQKKEEPIEYVPKREAYKFGYYIYIPSWFSYDARPKRISPLMFTVLSILPWYEINPFNGYLVKKNKWFTENCMKDFIYNPHERTDSILREEFGFNK